MEVSGKFLADVLGLSSSRVTRLKEQKVLQPKEGGKFDLAASVQAYLSFLKSGRHSAKVAKSRADLIAQQTRRLELDNARAEGHSVDIDDVGQFYMALSQTLVSTLQAWPGRLAGTLANESNPALIRELLLDEVRAIRTRLADAVDDYARRHEDAGWHELGAQVAAADAKGPDKRNGPPAC